MAEQNLVGEDDLGIEMPAGGIRTSGFKEFLKKLKDKHETPTDGISNDDSGIRRTLHVHSPGEKGAEYAFGLNQRSTSVPDNLIGQNDIIETGDPERDLRARKTQLLDRDLARKPFQEHIAKVKGEHEPLGGYNPRNVEDDGDHIHRYQGTSPNPELDPEMSSRYGYDGKEHAPPRRILHFKAPDKVEFVQDGSVTEIEDFPTFFENQEIDVNTIRRSNRVAEAVEAVGDLETSDQDLIDLQRMVPVWQMFLTKTFDKGGIEAFVDDVNKSPMDNDRSALRRLTEKFGTVMVEQMLWSQLT